MVAEPIFDRSASRCARSPRAIARKSARLSYSVARRAAAAGSLVSARKSAEPLGEIARFVDGVAPRRRDEDEGRRRIGEQGLDGLRSRPEACFHPFERAEEGDDVFHHFGADDARDGAQERLHRDARHPEVGARRHHQQPEDAVVEQPHEPSWRVEEVECVPGRRRVDDDEVVAPFVVQLVQLLHRHVFLRAAERAADVAVETVLEDALRLFLVRRVARDQPIERALGVEHQRRQPAARGRITGWVPPVA
jgi:hypothetical protein